jgi:hypothetical protein
LGSRPQRPISAQLAFELAQPRKVDAFAQPAALDLRLLRPAMLRVELVSGSICNTPLVAAA